MQATGGAGLRFLPPSFPRAPRRLGRRRSAAGWSLGGAGVGRWRARGALLPPAAAGREPPCRGEAGGAGERTSAAPCTEHPRCRLAPGGRAKAGLFPARRRAMLGLSLPLGAAPEPGPGDGGREATEVPEGSGPGLRRSCLRAPRFCAPHEYWVNISGTELITWYQWCPASLLGGGESQQRGNESLTAFLPPCARS